MRRVGQCNTRDEIHTNLNNAQTIKCVLTGSYDYIYICVVIYKKSL